MKPITVSDHENFHRDLDALHGLLRPHDFDDIDAELDDMLQVDPYNGDPPSRRKDREVSRVLGLLDSLERGTL